MCTGPLSYAIIKIKVAAKGKGREKAKRVDCCCSALEAPAGIVCLLLCCVTHSGASKHWASLSSFLVFFKGLRRGFCFFFFFFFFDSCRSLLLFMLHFYCWVTRDFPRGVARTRKLPRPIFLPGRGSYLLDYYRVLPYLPLESLDGIAVTFSFIVPSLNELNWAGTLRFIYVSAR